MSRANRRMLFFAILIAPVAALLYLYSNNAIYLDFGQVLIAAAAMIAVSALGYGVFRLITRSSLSAFCGCLTLWIGFYLFAHVYAWLDMNLYSSMLYALLVAALSIVLAFLVKRRKGAVVPPIAVSMAVVMLVMNAIPAGQAAYALSTKSAEASYKSDFAIDDTLSSPNVYWIHADGLLGFDAFETYFGDDQDEFKNALRELGFALNEDAYLEVGHRTVMAIPALMSPYFYDHHMAERCRTHEDAMYTAWEDIAFFNNGLQEARTYSETRLAFEARGYVSQTMGNMSIFFPPVSDRYYATIPDDGCYIIDYGENPAHTYMYLVQAGELSQMLTTINFTRKLIQFFPILSRYGISNITRTELEHKLDPEELDRILLGSKAALRHGQLFEALYDAMHTESPTFNTVYFMVAHSPFVADEMGRLTGKDETDLMNYPAQHRYSAKLLVEMAQMIVETDPDAVIVIQADHGLHLQSREQIAEKLGEDAVLPIWNQVTSAIRVPEKYKDGEENHATDNPLNISRYLINHFVGENYAYVEANETN